MSAGAGAMATVAADGIVDGLLDGLSRVTVLAAMSPQLPTRLVRRVLRQARRRDVEVTLLVADLTGRWDFLDDTAETDLRTGRLTVTVLAGAVPRHLAAAVEHLPVSLWEADRLIASGALDIDLLLARVGRCPDRAGSYGDLVGFTPAALGQARRVAFEVHPAQRRHPGTELDLRRADLLVETDPAGPCRSAGDPTAGAVPSAAQRRIAELTADLVPDGATVQLGVGVVPGEVAARLTGRRHLGLHSGILPGSVQQLLAAGAVTGARKSRDRNRHVATGLLGGNPQAWTADVLLQPISDTHNPKVLLNQHNLWALNSAYQVDLSAQVNAEYTSGLRRASGGGQADFARAAHAGTGASIISLPARTAHGTPRIVPQLGCPVTTPGADVDAVVTEYGVAHLTGRTASQRARALIAVAHPDDRPGLLASLSRRPPERTG